MHTIQLRDYWGAVEARKEMEIARMRRRELIEERVLMVVAFAPGAIVFLGFGWGLVKWALGI